MIDVTKLPLVVDPDFKGTLGPKEELFEIYLFAILGASQSDPILKTGIFIYKEIPRWCTMYFGEKEITIKTFHQIENTQELKMSFPRRIGEDFEMGQEISGKTLVFNGREWSDFGDKPTIQKTESYFAKM